MTNNCYKDNLYVKPFEVCNFKALVRLNEIKSIAFPLFNIDSNVIFSSNFKTANPDLNINIRGDNNVYNYSYNNLKKDLCYSPNNNSNFNVNCVIATNSPFYTYNKKKKTCSPIPNLALPKNFSYMYENDNTYIYKEDDENSLKFNYAFRIDKAYCENKWYDWIIVPNYHFGNQYEKDEGIYSKEDVRKCYKPCNKGYLPYTALNGSNICTLKTNTLDGLYSNKLDFSPISLINLIGNTSNDLNKLYTLIREIELLDYTVNTTNDYSIVSTVKTDTFDNAQYTNNEINDVYNQIAKVVVNDILDENNFNIDNYQYNKKVLTYKNPNFNEDEPELLTYRGMSKANMLSDAILFHTIYIANKYSNYINTIITTLQGKITSPDIKIDYNTEITSNTSNILINIKNILKDKIIRNEDIEKYYQRIANIFYKAINVCYNNKTDFSKNIFIKTNNIINKFKTNTTYLDKIKNIYYNTLTDDAAKLAKLTELYSIDNIEIPFYTNDEFNKTLKIATVIPTDTSTENTTKYQKLDADANLKIKERSNIVFFTTELNEFINQCKNNQIWNSDTKICETCATVCSTNKDNNTCLTNDRCALFCKDRCKVKDKKNVTKCGKIKEEKNNEKEHININDIDTPLDESNISIMYNMSYALRIAVKIFFYAIILYLCYIFYQLYGETLFTIANLFLYYGAFIFYFIYYSLNDNPLRYKYAFEEYKKRNAINKYERLVTKANSINP